jgi:hypothetical protein
MPPDMHGAESISGREEVNRALWNVLRTQGDSVEITATVRHGSVHVEAMEEGIDAWIHAQDDGVDVRVHDVQLVVKGKRVTLIQAHPPYPIERWTILWEGDLA